MHKLNSSIVKHAVALQNSLTNCTLNTGLKLNKFLVCFDVFVFLAVVVLSFLSAFVFLSIPGISAVVYKRVSLFSWDVFCVFLVFLSSVLILLRLGSVFKNCLYVHANFLAIFTGLHRCLPCFVHG